MFKCSKTQRVPFNWKTPFGYLMVLAFYIIGNFCTTLSSLSTICLLIGSCWLFNAFARDVTNDLALLKVNHFKHRHGREFYKRFCNIVHRYSDLKKLSGDKFFDWMPCSYKYLSLISQLLSLWIHFFLTNFYFTVRFVRAFNIIYGLKNLMIFFWVYTTIFTSLFVYLMQLVKCSFEYFWNVILIWNSITFYA